MWVGVVFSVRVVVVHAVLVSAVHAVGRRCWLLCAAGHAWLLSWLVAGVVAGIARRVQKKGTGCLLLEQEVHDMRDELLFARKNVLCLGVGDSPFKAVHAELHHLVDIQNGSSQVHF